MEISGVVFDSYLGLCTDIDMITNIKGNWINTDKRKYIQCKGII